MTRSVLVYLVAAVAVFAVLVVAWTVVDLVGSAVCASDCHEQGFRYYQYQPLGECTCRTKEQPK